MKKVLIVEDDIMLSEIYKKKFESSKKFEISSATSGKDAIEKAKSIIPDLILLDLVLPEMDGFEVIRELRKDNNLNKTKIVPFSNLSQEDNNDKLEEFKIDGFIVKSEFTPQELIFEVEKILNKDRDESLTGKSDFLEVEKDNNFKRRATKKDILLVDDDEFFLNVFGKKIEESGYVINKLNDKSRILEVLGDNFFLGIILSFDLFSSDIKEIISNINKKALENKTKIIILVSDEEESAKLKKMNNTVNVINKNKVNPNQFAEEIQKILK